MIRGATKGHGYVEYILILVLVAIVLILALDTLGVALQDVFAFIETKLNL